MRAMTLCLLFAATLAISLVARSDDTDIYRSLYDIEERGGNPQVMIIFDTSGSMEDVVGDTGGGTDEKLAIAKRVITRLVEQNPRVDFGLTIFNYNFPDPDGGRIVVDLPGEGRIKTEAERESSASSSWSMSRGRRSVSSSLRTDCPLPFPKSMIMIITK